MAEDPTPPVAYDADPPVTDEALLALLTDEQRMQYEAIQERYAQQMEQVAQEARRAFDTAAERTKEILTPEQADTYERMLRRRRDGAPSRGSRWRFRPDNDSPAPDTQD